VLVAEYIGVAIGVWVKSGVAVIDRTAVGVQAATNMASDTRTILSLIPVLVWLFLPGLFVELAEPLSILFFLLVFRTVE
jgi:hypothetical protein